MAAASIGDSKPYSGEVKPGGPPDVRELEALAALLDREGRGEELAARRQKQRGLRDQPGPPHRQHRQG